MLSLFKQQENALQTRSNGEAGTGTINNNFGDGSLIGSTGFGVENSSAPMAFLNMMFLPARESIDLVKGSTFAFDQIDISATQGINEPKNTNYDELRIDGFVAPDNGYIMVYLSNEGSNVTEVYFDDLSVEVNEGLVRQVSNYYPLGLQHNSSWTRPTDLKNNFLYNAGSELNELTSNYETFFRQYDAALGRFTAIDPVAAKYGSQTPYNYAFNDPIALNDPMGDDPQVDRFGDNWAMQEAYFWDAHGDYNGDIIKYTPVTYNTEAMGSMYDPAGRVGNWYESMPEYGAMLNAQMFRSALRGYYGGFDNGVTSVSSDGSSNYVSDANVTRSLRVWNRHVGKVIEKGKNKGSYTGDYVYGLDALSYASRQGGDLEWMFAQNGPQLSGGDVMADIQANGYDRFLDYINDPSYGVDFFFNYAKTFNVPAAGWLGDLINNSKVVSDAFHISEMTHGTIANGTQAANALEHHIGIFLMTYKYGPGTAQEIGFANEIRGLIINDEQNGMVYDALKGRAGTAFEWRDLGNNLQGAYLYAKWHLSTFVFNRNAWFND